MTNRVFFINVPKIEELAKKEGLSLTSLENKLNISHGTIVRWKKNGLAANTLGIVANHFGVKIDDLLERRES